MNKIKDWHIIKINREADVDIRNTLFIDDKQIFGIKNVKMEFGLDNRMPVVTIELHVNEVKGEIKTNLFNVIENKKK